MIAAGSQGGGEKKEVLHGEQRRLAAKQFIGLWTQYEWETRAAMAWRCFGLVPQSRIIGSFSVGLGSR